MKRLFKTLAATMIVLVVAAFIATLFTIIEHLCFPLLVVIGIIVVLFAGCLIFKEMK